MRGDVAKGFGYISLAFVKQPMDCKGANLHRLAWLEDHFYREVVGEVTHGQTRGRQSPRSRIHDPKKHLRNAKELTEPPARILNKLKFLAAQFEKHLAHQTFVFCHGPGDCGL